MTHIEDLSLFRPVETKSAPEIVFEELQNQILGRKYLPGDKLPPERTLMKVFGRSQIDDLVRQAREAQQAQRTRTRDRGWER